MFKIKEGIATQREFLDTIKLQRAGYEIVSNDRESYYNIPASFDIETTSFYVGEQKRALMYIWQFSVMTEVTTGRTWDEFVNLLDSLRKILGLNNGLRLLVYVHNLSYEWQFMRRWQKWDKTFFMDKRDPLYVLSNGIEFRCSLKLAGGLGLAKVGDNLTKYKINKMAGDLDYSLIRHSGTPLTEKELKYCENDVRVVCAYIQEQIEANGGIHKLPLTSTGFVRTYMRRECFRGWV